MVAQSRDPVFRALMDPTRRAILEHLRRGASPVHEIARRFDMSRPAVSKHLAVLRRARLVIDHREGRENICVLDPVPLRLVDRWLDEFRDAWQQRLGSLKGHVEFRHATSSSRAHTGKPR